MLSQSRVNAESWLGPITKLDDCVLQVIVIDTHQHAEIVSSQMMVCGMTGVVEIVTGKKIWLGVN